METRKLAQGRRRRRGMDLELSPEGGQIKSAAEEYLIKSINGQILMESILHDS